MTIRPRKKLPASWPIFSERFRKAGGAQIGACTDDLTDLNMAAQAFRETAVIIIILSLIVAAYVLVGLALALVIWKSGADDFMRERPFHTESEIKMPLFLTVMCLWPLFITKISVTRSEGVGIEFTAEEDEEDDRRR